MNLKIQKITVDSKSNFLKCQVSPPYNFQLEKIENNPEKKIDELELSCFNQIKNNLCLLKDPLTKSAVFSNEAQCQKAAEVITENTLIPYEVIKFNQKNVL